MEYFYLSHAWFSDERSELSVVLRVRLDVRVDVINLLPPITCTRKYTCTFTHLKGADMIHHHVHVFCFHLLDPDLFRG